MRYFHAPAVQQRCRNRLKMSWLYIADADLQNPDAVSNLLGALVATTQNLANAGLQRHQLLRQQPWLEL